MDSGTGCASDVEAAFCDSGRVVAPDAGVGELVIVRQEPGRACGAPASRPSAPRSGGGAEQRALTAASAHVTPNTTVVRRMGSLRLVGRLSKPQCEQEAPCVCNRLRRSKTARARSGAVSDGPPRQRSGAPPSHLQPVDRGPAFRLARKGLPHGRSRQSSEGPQRSAGPAKRVDGRDRPCVVNALRAQRGPYPVAPPTGLNPPTPLSGEPQFCPQILRKTRIRETHGPTSCGERRRWTSRPKPSSSEP